MIGHEVVAMVSGYRGDRLRGYDDGMWIQRAVGHEVMTMVSGYRGDRSRGYDDGIWIQG